MMLFFRCVGCALICTVLLAVLNRQNKDIALVLQMLVCVLLLGCGINCLEPVFQFIRRLEELGGLNSELVQLLLKVTGVALVTEIASLICADGGNTSLGKGLQMASGAVILCLSLPALSALLDLLSNLLEVA